MRLTEQQIKMIRRIAHEISGERFSVRVFGSKLIDSTRGGEVDLLLELQDPVKCPALIAAMFSARVSEAMHGRKVDVLPFATNPVRQSIHNIAMEQGQLL